MGNSETNIKSSDYDSKETQTKEQNDIVLHAGKGFRTVIGKMMYISKEMMPDFYSFKILAQECHVAPVLEVNAMAQHTSSFHSSLFRNLQEWIKGSTFLNTNRPKKVVLHLQ
jgi:hypothetical protein